MMKNSLSEKMGTIPFLGMTPPQKKSIVRACLRGIAYPQPSFIYMYLNVCNSFVCLCQAMAKKKLIVLKIGSIPLSLRFNPPPHHHHHHQREKLSVRTCLRCITFPKPLENYLYVYVRLWRENSLWV